jgi:hypothetical protein
VTFPLQSRQSPATVCGDPTELPEGQPKPAGLPSGSYAFEDETAREHIANCVMLLELGRLDEPTRAAVVRRLRLALAALTPEAV